MDKGVKGRTKRFFLIILLIVFILLIIAAIWFFVINKFAPIGPAPDLSILKFKNDLQSDINAMYQSTQGSQKETYYLPNKIKQVCFTNNKLENIYFIPDEFKGDILNNLDIEGTLNGLEELCFPNLNGKVSMTIKKEYNGEGVIITK